MNQKLLLRMQKLINHLIYLHYHYRHHKRKRRTEGTKTTITYKTDNKCTKEKIENCEKKEKCNPVTGRCNKVDKSKPKPKPKPVEET